MSDRRAVWQDRRLFAVSHPVLYPTLSALALVDVVRLGSTVVVSEPGLIKRVLMEAPLDRVGEGTTGAVIADALGIEALFSGDGETHRVQRALLARHLARPEPLDSFAAVIGGAAERLREQRELDLAPHLNRAAGATAIAMLGLETDPAKLAALVDRVADAGARQQLTGRGSTRAPAERLLEEIRTTRRSVGFVADAIEALGERAGIGVAGVAAVATAATTAAASSRLVAWLSDADAWAAAAAAPDGYVAELLRVLTPSPIMPRRLAGDFTLGSRSLRAGARIILNTRAACRRESRHVDVDAPDLALAQLAFGFGPHSCPGAALARRQLATTIGLLAPLAPVVTHRRSGRGRALPRWDELMVRTDP